MRELADSAGLAGDAGALRGRLAADGYLFFRGILPAARLTAIGTEVAGRLRSGGWTDERGIPSASPRAVNSMDALADPAFRAAALGAAFNQIPYLPELRRLVRLVLGPGAFSYPAKVLRAVYPERPGARTRGRYVHHDYAVSGVQDMLTSWVPLMSIPAAVGGLAVRPAGQLGPPGPPRVLGRAEPGWATTDYRPGDVIIFHCLLPHAALPNTAPVLRLSGDFRWQLPDGPAPAELVFGPAGRPPELFSRMFGHLPWWEPVPAGLRLRSRSELVGRPPGRSRFFSVHPGWRHWQPPPAVH